MFLGEVKIPIGNRFLYPPKKITDDLLTKDPDDIDVKCYPVGESVRMVFHDEGYNVVIDLPLTEWKTKETEYRSAYKRSFSNSNINIKRWHNSIDVVQRNGESYTVALLQLIETEGDTANSTVEKLAKTTDQSIGNYSSQLTPIGKTRVNANSRSLYFPAYVIEELFGDKPDEVDASCQLIGDSLRIIFSNTPHDIVVDIPLTEWTVEGSMHKRSFSNRKIFAEKWKEMFDMKTNEDGKYVVGTIHLATMEDVDYNSILKTTSRGVTHHKAQELVDSYCKSFRQTKTRVDPHNIINYHDLEDSPHNHTRIRQVLEERFDVVESKRPIKTFAINEGV